MACRDDAVPSAAARRRQRWIAGIACLACAAVLVAGWDTGVYLYYLYRFRSDPAALSTALFQGKETPRGRAARESVLADEREADFAHRVAGRAWWAERFGTNATILGRSRYEHELRALPSADAYELWTLLRLGRHESRMTRHEETRSVRVWGPFLLDASDPGRIDTWALLEGELILGAMVRLTPRDWIYLRSVKPQGEVRHNFIRLTFDRELTGASQRRFRLSGRGSSPLPVLRSDAPELDFAAGWESTFDAVADAGSHAGRMLVKVADARMFQALQLDLQAGVGRVDAWDAIAYEERPQLEAK